MITRVEIENFKAIEKLSMDFTSRLTVIVGPNGSGKTSILECISFAAMLAGNPNVSGNTHLADIRKNYSRGAKTPFRVTCDTPEGKLDVQMRSSRDGSLKDVAEIVSIIPNMENERGANPLIAAEMFPAELLRLNATEISKPGYGGEIPVLGRDGSGTPAVLAQLCLSEPDRFKDVVTRFRQVIPQVVNLRFKREKIRRQAEELLTINGEVISRTRNYDVVGEQVVVDLVDGADVSGEALSEGTLLTLAFLTAIHRSRLPSMLLLDDLELSLHPSAQRELIGVLRELLSSCKELQVIATSHSPYLLDSLSHDEIRLATLDDQGRVVSGTLMDHPDFERWKDEMTPGEMWSMFGEKWLTARPSAKAPAEITP